MIFSEEGKRLLAVSPFEATKSVFIKPHEEKIVFQLQYQAIGTSRGGEEIINKLEKLLEMRHEWYRIPCRT